VSGASASLWVKTTSHRANAPPRAVNRTNTESHLRVACDANFGRGLVGSPEFPEHMGPPVGSPPILQRVQYTRNILQTTFGLLFVERLLYDRVTRNKRVLYSCFPKAPTVALARKFSPSLDAGPPGDGWMMILHPAVHQQFMGRGQFANDLNFFVHREKTHWQCIYNLNIPFYMPKHPRLRKVRSNRRFGRFALINEKCSTTRIIPEIIPTIFQEPIRERLVSCDVRWCPVLRSST
jgi:hypothetical protein